MNKLFTRPKVILFSDVPRFVLILVCNQPAAIFAVNIKIVLISIPHKFIIGSEDFSIEMVRMFIGIKTPHINPVIATLAKVFCANFQIFCFYGVALHTLFVEFGQRNVIWRAGGEQHKLRTIPTVDKFSFQTLTLNGAGVLQDIEEIRNRNFKLKPTRIVNTYISLPEVAPISSVSTYFFIEYKTFKWGVVKLFWL